ncbi:MAG TPA: MFS transporter [Solirubrobacteraceae bacterium]|nr:MFS transporter [Solirubrobacteraceae bacterium]
MENQTASPPGEPAEDAGGWLTRGVASVGAASFLSDAGHEIATAILPSFITTVLHSTAAALGVIEGVSDALTGVAKLLAGPLANDAQRRGRIATGGYLGTAVATGAIGLAGTVWQAGALRALAWVSRGVRSPARDSLLASLAPKDAYGRAFGLERAGDNLGAVAGPLLAAGLVAWLGIRPAIYFAFIPGALAAVAILTAARAARQLPQGPRERARIHLVGLREAGLLRPLVPVALYECGNLATTLLILRATQLLHGGSRTVAAAASLAILIYAAHNALAAILAYAGGHWLDHVGPRIVFATGAMLYVLAYLGFAAGPHTWPLLLLFFCLAGAGIGLGETSESTLVARTLPERLRGSGFGVLGGVQAAGDLIATVTAGILYAAISPTVAFLYAATWMLASLLSTSLLGTGPGGL